MSRTKCRVAGRIRVPLAPVEAFRLFTARGEREWVHGWDPIFPAPVSDDSEAGTVFVTDAHGQRTIWVVTDSQPPKRITYACFRPEERAGTISITVDALDPHSEVEVVYQLTSLAPIADTELEQFAEGYADYLQHWEHAITSAIRHQQ